MSPHPVSAAGSARTFDDWWSRDGEWVEPPNQRRNGESGVKRVHDSELGLVYIKRQTNHLYRDLRYPLGRPTVLREQDVIEGFARAGVTVPDIVFCGARKRQGEWQALLVTRALDGYESLFHWYKHGHRDGMSDDTHARLLRTIGKTLARFHRHGWQHTCLYAKHIFLTAEPRVDGLPAIALLDLEKGRQLPSPVRAARRDLAQLRRHSKMWSEADWLHVLEGHRIEFGRSVF